jgi:CBS domain-containing protein
MPLLKAASVMVRHKFRRIPVDKDGILLGMISIGDIHKAIFQSNLTRSRPK